MTHVPRSVSLQDLERLVATVGEREGWDFSHVRMTRDPVPWDYEDVVRRYLHPTDRVLDVGTGGGEMFLQLADAFGEGVGVDTETAMVEAARRNLPASLSDRIQFELTTRSHLRFPAESFDVVLNRHAGVDPDSVVHVLRPGGWFIFQGLGNRKNEQIWEAFGWEPIFPSRLGMEPLIEAFEQRGCDVVVTGDESNRAWFCDIESLVFYLRAIHLPEPFDPARHLDRFNRYLTVHAGPNGYAATEHGNLLIARKIE